MFEMFSMMGNYEQRKVARYPAEGDFLVDTAAVTDSEQPYETAVQHPRYNKGEMIIAEMYKTREAALEGHKRWVKIMTAKKLPKQIRDVSTCSIVALGLALGKDVRKSHRLSKSKKK